MEGVQKSYHQNSQLAVIGNAVNGKEEGKWVILDTNGDTLKVEAYQAGEVIDTKVYKESRKVSELD